MELAPHYHRKEPKISEHSVFDVKVSKILSIDLLHSLNEPY